MKGIRGHKDFCFQGHPKTPKSWQAENSCCLVCISLRNKKRYKQYSVQYKKKANIYRLKNPLRVHEYQLKRKFGITIKQYEDMFKNQKGACAICGGVEKTKHNITKEIRRLSIDHSHKTGKVRGLLCNACNTGLGKFKERYDLLAKAILYLAN